MTGPTQAQRRVVADALGTVRAYAHGDDEGGQTLIRAYSGTDDSWAYLFALIALAHSASRQAAESLGVPVDEYLDRIRAGILGDE